MTYISPTHRPPSTRHYSHWTDAEDTALEEGYRLGTPPEVIAIQLGRTPAAVAARAAMFGARPQSRCPLPPCDFDSLVNVCCDWAAYPRNAQDVFLTRIGAVRITEPRQLDLFDATA